MAKLTVTIDDALLRRVCIRALARGTSVNAIVREFLEAFAGEDRTRDALDEFLIIATTSAPGSGPEGRAWTREELHER